MDLIEIYPAIFSSFILADLAEVFGDGHYVGGGWFLQCVGPFLRENCIRIQRSYSGDFYDMHVLDRSCQFVRLVPYYNDWRKRFKASSFSIIGIHRPEIKQERDVEKVKDKAVETGMEYPIAIDNESLVWDAWANRIWPSIYLIDKNGFVRYWWYGELNWQGAETEKYLRDKIQELIEEPFV